MNRNKKEMATRTMSIKYLKKTEEPKTERQARGYM